MPAQGGDRGDPLLAVMLPCPFSLLKNGELIYGCKDARSPAADWSELAHHLKPFFFPSNGLASGPHCTRAVIRELVRVITRVLLSGSDKGWASAVRLGPGSRGPCVCEASPFRRSLRHQGRPGGRRASKPSLGEACVGLAWRHGASAGAAWALAGLPKASSCLSAPLGRLPFHVQSRFVNCSTCLGCRVPLKHHPACLYLLFSFLMAFFIMLVHPLSDPGGRFLGLFFTHTVLRHRS